MIDVIVTIIILYFLYKLVFDFVVPVAKTTSHFKSQVNEMNRMQQEEMRRRQQQQQASQQQNYSRANQSNTTKDTTTTDGEYIDFEEIK